MAFGADVNYAFGTEWRPIHGAAVSGDVTALQLFLKHGIQHHAALADPVEFHRMALHKAVAFGRTDCVRALARVGKNVDAQDDQGDAFAQNDRRKINCTRLSFWQISAQTTYSDRVTVCLNHLLASERCDASSVRSRYDIRGVVLAAESGFNL